MYIDINTREIVTANDIIHAYPYTSFPSTVWTDELLQPFGFAVIQRPAEHPSSTENEKLVDGVPYEENGKWYLPYIVVALTADEIAQRLDQWRQSAWCSPFQGRMALANANLLSTVETAISQADEKTIVAWEYALEWKRNSPMIATLMAALNITDIEADDLFKSAQQITA